jgi:hypothetical protein
VEESVPKDELPVADQYVDPEFHGTKQEFQALK